MVPGAPGMGAATGGGSQQASREDPNIQVKQGESIFIGETLSYGSRDSGTSRSLSADKRPRAGGRKPIPSSGGLSREMAGARPGGPPMAKSSSSAAHLSGGASVDGGVSGDSTKNVINAPIGSGPGDRPRPVGSPNAHRNKMPSSPRLTSASPTGGFRHSPRGGHVSPRGAEQYSESKRKKPAPHQVQQRFFSGQVVNMEYATDVNEERERK